MRLFQVSVLLLAILSFSACGSNLKTFKDNSNGWLPSDFDPRTSVLLIQRVKWPERQQRLIREFMKEKYPFKYRFLKSPNLDEDFPDKTTHRFVLYYSQTKKTPLYQPELNRQRAAVDMFDYHFYDRSTGKSYPASGIGGSFASQPFKYMINHILEKFKQ